MGNSNEKKPEKNTENNTGQAKHYPSPNLDLINMVQRARMHNDSTALPSQAAAMYWIEAKRSAEIAAPPVTNHAAQWIITTTADRADALWVKIKAATEAGQLGYKSKICTASRTLGKPDERVIVVCTYDGRDAVDVERVHVALQNMITPADELHLA